MEKRIKLNISPYNITLDDGRNVPFLVQNSLSALLFNPALELNATEVRRNDQIARQIEDCKDSDVLLSLDNFKSIKEAINKFKGFDRNAIPLLDRIDSAEEVEVDVKEKING